MTGRCRRTAANSSPEDLDNVASIAAPCLLARTERRIRMLVVQTDVARGARKAVEAISVQSFMM